jgi:hypothetical protein
MIAATLTDCTRHREDSSAKTIDMTVPNVDDVDRIPRVNDHVVRNLQTASL